MAVTFRGRKRDAINAGRDGMAPNSLARRVYLGTAWLYLVTLVAQVFTIGLYLFADADLGPHFLGAFVLFGVSIVVFVVSLAAGLPGRVKLRAGALIGLTMVQGILAALQYSGLGTIAALHPVNALFLFWLGLVVLRDAQKHLHSAGMSPATEETGPVPLA